MNRRFDKCGHDGDTQAATSHNENLHEFPSPLKILGHHQCGAVTSHADADSHHSGYERRDIRGMLEDG